MKNKVRVEKTNKKILHALSFPGESYLKLKALPQILIVIFLLILKNDLNIVSANIKSVYLPAATALPKPMGYFSESLGNLLLAKLFHVQNLNAWVIMHFIILTIFLFIIFLVLHQKRLKDNKIFLFLILTTPPLSVVLQTFGTYDVFTFFGGVLFVILNSRSGVIIASIFMVLGNPEQTILAIFSVYILSCIRNFREYREKCYIGCAVAVPVWFIIQCWMFLNNVRGTRLTLIPHFIDLAVLSFWSDPLVHVWSYFGVLWLLIIYLLFYFIGKDKFYLLTSLVLIPLSATLITADGVRVFALVNLPTFFIVILYFWHSIIPSKLKTYYLSIYLIVWISVPSGLYNNRTIGILFSNIISKAAGTLGNQITNIGLNLLS